MVLLNTTARSMVKINPYLKVSTISPNWCLHVYNVGVAC